MFPHIRLRRLRNQAWLRAIVTENIISVNDLIWPIFICEGENKRDPIPTMPDIFRYSIDELLKQLDEVINLGIKAIALFPNIDTSLKNDLGSEAHNPNNLICRAIRTIKQIFPNLGVICDVALDPYTTHGHDGLLDQNGYVENELTLEALTKQALILAEAGCDMVAPSDMMDGRIMMIRKSLDLNGFYNLPILSYSAKYASGFYAAFREAIGSQSALRKKDKKHYQMNPANSREAIREMELDINEGADALMIKPGLPYLDIIKTAYDNFHLPIFAYHVSSEYGMLKFAAQNNCIDYNNVLMETMIAFKRAGCSGIFTYAALDVAKILNEGYYD